MCRDVVDTLTVRPLETGDLWTFCEWLLRDRACWQALGETGVSTTHAVWRVANRHLDNRDCWAVVDDGGLLGVLIVQRYEPEPNTGVVHILVAPFARGRGIAIAKAGLAAAKSFGWTRLVAAPAPFIPPAVHKRWLRRVGFTIRHVGDWHADGGGPVSGH